MKKIILLQLLLFCFAAEHLSAQVPGYRGKRFSAGYNASSFFYFPNFNLEQGVGDLIFSTRLSYKTELYANYALSRKVNIGFSYYNGKQKTYFKPQYVDFYEVIPKKEFVLCKIDAFELHFKFFRNDFVAPVGLYYQFSFGMVKYSAILPGDTLALYSNDQGNTLQQFTVHKPFERYTCFKIGYHVGKTNPIGNNFFINTAIGINIFTGGDYQGVLSQSDRSSVNNYLLKNFNKGLLSHNLLEIKLGLGWLAF
ncbi:MAG: hypothetical protein ABIQ40_04890 [Bacteroidia bacterium]